MFVKSLTPQFVSVLTLLAVGSTSHTISPKSIHVLACVRPIQPLIYHHTD